MSADDAGCRHHRTLVIHGVDGPTTVACAACPARWDLVRYRPAPPRDWPPRLETKTTDGDDDA